MTRQEPKTEPCAVVLDCLAAHAAGADVPHDGSFGAPPSEMSQLVERTDWAAGPLGAPDTWPQSLRTAVGICLSSRFPILLWWGPELVMVYNDAYRPMLGQSKHPRALGAPGKEVWTEIWDVIGPMLDQVMAGGGATWSRDELLVLDRNGYPEECYFTYSYSPITDESGGVGGVFCAVTETTERVIGERRLATLADLAGLMGSASRAEVLRTAGTRARHQPRRPPVVLAVDAPLELDRLAPRGRSGGPGTWRLGRHPRPPGRPRAPGRRHRAAGARPGRRGGRRRRHQRLARLPRRRVGDAGARPGRQRSSCSVRRSPAAGTRPSRRTPPCA